MKFPHAYTPAICSKDLPPVEPTAASKRVKIHQALVWQASKGNLPIRHAARGYNFAFVEMSMNSRWVLKRGASSPELFADLINDADSRGRRWRVVHVVSAEIRTEG